MIEQSSNRKASLSWLIVSTRDYKKQFYWFWDKKHLCCYGMPKEETLNTISESLYKLNWRWAESTSYFDDCVLMPELQMYDVEVARDYIIKWCNDNGIEYEDDFDNYRMIYESYWGYYD